MGTTGSPVESLYDSASVALVNTYPIVLINLYWSLPSPTAGGVFVPTHNCVSSGQKE